jgi:outer membrane protein OmpA-like peptidoglycan-associated protein
LQQAIDTWTPPPAPETEPVPKIVRLDSMSLFDSGKSALKDGSTKILVNALVGIKARPGWLIVVSGHRQYRQRSAQSDPVFATS